MSTSSAAATQPAARHTEAAAGAASSVLFIGTATTLIRYAGFTVLTDPNFLHRGERAYLGYGMWSKRRTDPALDPEDLPPVDVVVLSHLHGDHFDRVAAARLDHELPVVTTRDAAVALRRKGFRNSVALTTWQTQEVRRGDATLRITALPGRHAPGPIQALFPAVMGSLLEFRSAPDSAPLRLYITGDTLVHPALAEVRTRHPEIDLALLHLGGTRVMGLLVTMDARQGVDLLELIQPHRAIPIHNDDYPRFRSSVDDFRREVAARRPPAEVTYLERGEMYPLWRDASAVRDTTAVRSTQTAHR